MQWPHACLSTNRGILIHCVPGHTHPSKIMQISSCICHQWLLSLLVGGFYGRLVTNVFAVPALCFIMCGLLYLYNRHKIATLVQTGAVDETAFTEATVTFQRTIFFSIFLVYPMVTATLFRVPQCEQLGSDSYHEDDFSMPPPTSRTPYNAITSLVQNLR